MAIDPKTKARLVAACRKVWRWSSERRECRKKAEVKDGRILLGYRCAECGKIFERKLTAIDHTRPVVGAEGFTTWDTFLANLFCEGSNLQVVCKPCHRTKTLTETKARAKFRRDNKEGLEMKDNERLLVCSRCGFRATLSEWRVVYDQDMRLKAVICPECSKGPAKGDNKNA